MKCVSCGHLLTKNDCYCDGVICGRCGKTLKEMSCKGECGGCTQQDMQVRKSEDWLIKATIESMTINTGRLTREAFIELGERL